MSLSPQLVNTLKKVNEAPFTNPQHPMVAALIKSGHVNVDAGNRDPNDASRVAITLTALGHETNGTIPPAPTAPVTPVATVATETKEPSMDTATDTATMPAAATVEKV